jgi:hypothetical protein
MLTPEMGCSYSALFNVEFRIHFNGTGDRDVFRIHGERDSKPIWISAPKIYEIRGENVFVKTATGSVYNLVDKANDEFFMENLKNVIKNGGFEVV